LGIVTAAPSGSSSDLLHPQVCDPSIGCVQPAVCVGGVFCQADPCDPAADCAATLFAEPTTCAINATIHGSTCVTEVGIGVQAKRSLSAPVVGEAGATRVDVDLSILQGQVSDLNLPNGWITPILTVDAGVIGLPLGATSVGLYRSDIQTPGRPLAPDVMGQDHTWSQTTLELRQSGGQAGEVDAAVAVLTLDHVPAGCFVVTSTAAVPDFGCPRPPQLLP
jgi:hypothetical protein